jgi:hypothetical protein
MDEAEGWAPVTKFILWIIVFTILAGAVYFLIKSLMGNF